MSKYVPEKRAQWSPLTRMLSRLSPTLAVLSLMAGAPVAADNLSEVEIPAGYEQYREPTLYVRFGHGPRALRRAIADHDFDSAFLEHWFFDGIVAILDVSSLALPDDVHTSEEAYQYLVTELKARWGDYSFSIYEPESDIGRFVNYAGAFVAISWRKVGEKIQTQTTLTACWISCEKSRRESRISALKRVFRQSGFGESRN